MIKIYPLCKYNPKQESRSGRMCDGYQLLQAPLVHHCLCKRKHSYTPQCGDCGVWDSVVTR